MAAAQNEADRLKNENDARWRSPDRSGPAETGQRCADGAAQNEADRLKRENDAQRASAQAELDRAAKEKAQAEAEKAELRAQLLAQFNAILQTRDTARGLIVNMSDVLFDTAKYSLRPLAREKLAKVAGIVSGHPGLRLDVEGYTDSVGGDEYNQRLSEQRGGSVRDYLIQQGMAGFGHDEGLRQRLEPVASNDTAQGRQQNRRVELVISGEIIGTEIGTPIAPGIVLIFAPIDRLVRMSLRIEALEVPAQDVVTRDNVTVKVNAVIFFRVIDPRLAVLEVSNYLYATSQLAQTTLRSVLGEAELDELLSQRGKLNLRLQSLLDQHTASWGMKVTLVEVKQVELAEQMIRAIARQAEAERERRAKVIHAEGEYLAAEKLAMAAAVIQQQHHEHSTLIRPHRGEADRGTGNHAQRHHHPRFGQGKAAGG
jgi:regulator of protease activity HflC (stomatin/prohibitin superfamily)